MTDAAPLRTDAKAVVGAFLVSGVVHLVRPQTFEPLMPGWVPAHREVILLSGVAELLCAVGLLVPRARRVAGPASAAVLLGVYPGNLKMALDASRTPSTAFKVAAFARLPLQLPLVRGALRAGR
ncbi:DoxX family protein [Nocardioides marmoribigeumensis]|uniref:Membrane protein n=1 Tax=Nocardioides marmoribigeumensis TaxID=433649 RepID=A0ABU2BTQ4_9ACTN|nr:DoxX family protein [Nocardioides marmoribigeumensis]MDR7361409.1 putative membrane protein [Nocardioides marmoribigeumensis]